MPVLTGFVLQFQSGYMEISMSSYLKSLPLWLITGSIFLLLFFPYLFSNGMFMDGLLYAAVSRNLAEMPDFLGNLFKLSYTDTLLKEFYDQPPLAMWLQALMFRILGDSIYVERAYSFLAALSCVLLISLLWRLVYDSEEAGLDVSWLPVLYWSVIPLVFWSFSNNMLENTLAVFALLAVYCALKGLTGGKHLYIYVGSSLAIFLAFLAKSFVGLFPLATIPIYWLIKRDVPLATALKIFVKFFLCTVIIFVLFFSFESSRHFFKENLNAQIIPSMKGELNTVAGKRFHLLQRLAKELLPLLAFSLIFWGCKVRMNLSTGAQLKKEWFWIFLLLAVSGSFPIMLSFKQKGYYLVPSFAFYAIAFAILVQPTVHLVMRRLYESGSVYGFIKWFSFIFLFCSIGFSISQIGKVRRDADRLTDLQLVSQAIQPVRLISLHASLAQDWNLIGYLARNHKVSVVWTNLTDFYLVEKGCADIPASYSVVELPTIKYQLLKKE